MKHNINFIIHLMDKYSDPELDFEKKIEKEIGEQDAPSSGGGGGGGKSPYPTVTKWASGRKFGPTYNPEQKVWASGVTRGKANTLL